MDLISIRGWECTDTTPILGRKVNPFVNNLVVFTLVLREYNIKPIGEDTRKIHGSINPVVVINHLKERKIIFPCYLSFNHSAKVKIRCPTESQSDQDSLNDTFCSCIIKWQSTSRPKRSHIKLLAPASSCCENRPPLRKSTVIMLNDFKKTLLCSKYCNQTHAG